MRAIMTTIGGIKGLALLAKALVVLWTGLSPAAAQTYPSDTVKIVVPFVAGGGVDAVARAIQPLLSEALGQTVIIDNRGGAGGQIAAAAVAKAPADGYTLLFGTGSTHGTNSAVYPRLSYDPIKDFTPIVLVSASPLLLVTGAQLPVKTAADVIRLGREQPGKLSYGSYGTGSINHLAGELFNAMTGIQATHIPYRGSSPAQTDLVTGRIDFMFSSGSALLGYFEAGTMKLVGVAGHERWPVVPDRPTISESGLPGYEASVWFGLFAPAGTPKPVVDLLNSKVNAVLAVPRIKESFAKLGVETQGGSPDVLARRVETEVKKWSDLVRDRNIRIDQQ
jgi:tripartite-type tricarboxylate transporter receptor subunit TctC